MYVNLSHSQDDHGSAFCHKTSVINIITEAIDPTYLEGMGVA